MAFSYASIIVFKWAWFPRVGISCLHFSGRNEYCMSMQDVAIRFLFSCWGSTCCSSFYPVTFLNTNNISSVPILSLTFLNQINVVGFITFNIPYFPEILILGCGKYVQPVSPEPRKFIRSTGMKLEAIDSVTFKCVSSLRVQHSHYVGNLNFR